VSSERDSNDDDVGHADETKAYESYDEADETYETTYS